MKTKDFASNIFYKTETGTFFKMNFVIYFMLLFVGINLSNAADYYVSLTGDNNNNGISESNAWRTITYAATKAQAGDIVHIKSGNYGHEHVVVSKSGTDGNPIIFQGYDGMPVIDGQDDTGNGIYVFYSNYIEIRNIKVDRYSYGVYLNNANHIILDNIIVTDWGTTKTRDTIMQGGIFLLKSHYCELRNCNVTDARMNNFGLQYSNYNLIENCTSYGIRTFSDTGEDLAAGYYFTIAYASYNTIQNSFAQNKHASVAGSHYGHGFIIKDNPTWEGSAPHSHDNKIINCTSRGMAESFVSSHKAYNNYFLNCENYRDDLVESSWNYGLRVRDGSYNNTYENCKADGFKWGITTGDTGESAGTPGNDNNLFKNCIITNTDDKAIYFNYAHNNRIENCIIKNSAELVGGFTDVSSTALKNCIVTDVDSWGTGNPLITYSNFWNNGFATPQGTGNIEKDPLFANPANGDFHLKSRYGRYNGTTWVFDAITSSCIDAGDPSSDFSCEPQPNGGRINIGAYGNTAEASKSAFIDVPFQPPLPPINGSNKNSYVYPNPYVKGKNSEEKIIFANLPKEATIRIYTLYGDLIKVIKNIADGNFAEWNISNVKSGIYIYYIQSLDGENKGKLSIIK